MAERFFNQVNGTQGYCVYHQYMRKRLAGETQALSFTFNTSTAFQNPTQEHFAVILDGSFHQDHWDPCQYKASGVAPLQGRGIVIGTTYLCPMHLDFEHFGGKPTGTASSLPACVGELSTVGGQVNIVGAQFPGGGDCSDLTIVPGESYNIIVQVDDTSCSYYVKGVKDSNYEYASILIPTVAWQERFHHSSIMIYDVCGNTDATEFSFCNIAASIT